MTLTQILLTLRARWRAVGIVFAVVLGLTIVVLALTTPQYKATASVMLDVKSADPVAGDVIPALGISSYMATQVDLLRSERVLRRALKALGADHDQELINQWQRATDRRGDLLAWLCEQVLRKLEVQPSRESNVITFSYAAASPEEAATVVNAITKAFIETTVELRVDQASQYNVLFDARVRQLRNALEQEQAKLSAAQRDAGMVVSDGRIDVETARLTELSGQLLAAQIAAGDSGARTQVSRDSSDRMQEVLSNPLVSSLTSDLAREEARLADLSSRLGDRHPDVEKSRANIVQLKSRLDVETRKVVGGVAVTNTLAATKLAQVKAAYELQRAQLARLKEQRDQLTLLQRDVDNANQAYSAAVARAGQTELQTQGRQTNVTVIQEATPPAKPFKPRVALGLLLGVFAGLLLGLGYALIRELMDQRLRGDDDVAVWLDQPLLGVLPARPQPARRMSLKPFLSWGH